ncbi:MAG: protein kinase [Anaerolineae bacterium]|nr:protein kinase [Anaerolineae bacterium]
MQPGDRIENYVLIEQIGQGGQAAVWSAEDEQLKRMVAVKTIDLTAPIVAPGSSMATIGADEQAARFRSEAKIIAELEHPNILPIYSFGQRGNWLYIVMRYMAGGTLRKLINREKVDLDRLIKLAEPLADALDMAHQHRIVHRDIKSVNVLLDAQHRPYLADFGLSVTIGDPSQQSGSGTLAYMSPEQLRGEPVDHRSDIYAFGILLYEMLTKDVPAAGNQHWNLAQMISRAALPVPDDAPHAVAEVLRRTTAYDPADRYPSAMAVIEALRAAQRTLEASAAEAIDDGLLTLLPISDPAYQAQVEAERLFAGALEKWADGAGRFRLYEEDFKYVDSFYSVGDELGMSLDEAARRLMLRGALEHGHNLDYWWEQAGSVAEQRAVALQTLSSELASARLRAIERLESIPDSHPPAIPIRVATIIHRDPEPAVRLAGVRLLEARAEKATAWRDFAFGEVIDNVLADLASNDAARPLTLASRGPADSVAQAAARAIGRIRAGNAARKVAQHAAEGSATAREALIAIRDEAPSLPPGVEQGLRARTFGLLSLRQFFRRGLLARYLGAALGFGLGFAAIQFFQYGERELLFQQAVGNAIASGALYGALAGLAVLFASELAARLRAWNRIGRILLALVVGSLFSALLFIVLRQYYYFNPEPVDNVIWLVGPIIVFIAGFALASGLTRNVLLRMLGGGLGVFLAVYGSHLAYETGQTYDPVLFFNQTEGVNQPLALSLILAVLLGVVTYLPDVVRRLRGNGRS